MNVIGKGAKKPRKPNFKQRLNFRVKFEEPNPDKVVNKKVLADITKDGFGNTTNIHTTNSGDSQVILALTEGRLKAKGEVGIALMDINSPSLVLSQISDNIFYSDTINKIQVTFPVIVLLPDTIFESSPVSQLVQLIKDNFKNISIIPVQRKYFCDKEGLKMLQTFGSRRSVSILPVISKKYYCLSAASALLNYLKTVNMLSFAKSSLKIDYHTKQLSMMIDPQTASRLELLYSLSNERNARKIFSLYNSLNNCQTRIGNRHLRANILEPSCSINFICNRQEQIKILMEDDELLLQLQENLQNFVKVDQLLKISYVVPADNCEKAIETNIQMALLLKQCLEAVKPLCDVVVKMTSESFENSRRLLISPAFTEIVKKIDEIVQPDITKNQWSQKHLQHLNAVRSGVNETIDFLRKLHSEASGRVREYVAELTERHRLPFKLLYSAKLGQHLYLKNPNNLPILEEFHVISKKGANIYLTTSGLIERNDSVRTIESDLIKLSNTVLCELLANIAVEMIDFIHCFISVVIDLDLVQSLAIASGRENYCCPSFGRVMRIEGAYHPMLESARTMEEVIANNVIATPQYNFNIISGPNMSGKTIYIKTIAIVQIMAQIGCFIPASVGMMRMTDKIFSRIGFQDSIEHGASSFTVELREMEYIYNNLTPNSLVIVDELCRSTNPQEGELICWNICEKLLHYIGVSNDDYFKSAKEIDEEGNSKRQNQSDTLNFRGVNAKLKDIARPFIYVTTHFDSLTKLSDKFCNVINLHMLVNEKIVDEKPRMEFKYKIKSGPSNIKSYGLALARCLRFPTSLLDRAEEIYNQVEDESLIDVMRMKKNGAQNESSMVNETFNTTNITQEVTLIDKDVNDLFSYILMLLSFGENNQTETVNVEIANQSLAALIAKLSPAFRELIKNSSLEEIVNILNSSLASESSVKNMSIP